MFEALYYPFWDPPAEWLRSTLLLFDRIDVLLPEGVNPAREKPNLELIDRIPEAFGEIKKRHYEMTLAQPNLDILESAFAEIAAASHETLSGSRVFRIDSAGGLEVGGFSFLHVSKLSQTIERLLERYGLVWTGAEMLTGADQRLVESRAASLIVALAAEHYARGKGLRTLTDDPLDFVVVSMDRHPTRQQDAIAMSLASAVIALEVPAYLTRLPVETYVDIRKRYECLRGPFHHAMRELCSDGLLTAEMSGEELAAAAKEIAGSFFSEVEKIRQHPWANGIVDWLPIGIGALTTFLSAPFVDLPTAALVGSGAKVSLDIYKNVKTRATVSEKDRAMNLMAGLRSKLVDEVLIRGLVQPPTLGEGRSRPASGVI